MEMFVLKTIMTFGLVLHLGGPVDAVMVLLGFQEPPAQALRCVDNPALCQMEVASISIASADWSVSREKTKLSDTVSGDTTSGDTTGLRLSAAEAAQRRTIPMNGSRRSSISARHVGLNTVPHRARVSNEDM